DPVAGDLEGVYVYDVDDMHTVVADKIEQRRSEAERAEELVREELLRFARSTREARAVPIIKALRRYMLEVALAEADKTLVVLGDVASERQKKSVEAMARAIVNKVLHEPIARLKEQGAATAQSQTDLFAAVQELFPLLLDEDEGSDEDAVMREAAEAAAVAVELVDTGRVEEQVRLALVGK
ncbi:MAG: hypothetical protein ACO3JL_19015, partial [Myxococcota bacterium]